MKIAQIAPLWERVPPPSYGGAEMIISSLTEGLVAVGHEVTLFATGDSKTSAKLVSVYPKALYRDKISWDDPGLQLLNASEVYLRAGDFDIIHGHISSDYYGVLFSKMVKQTPSIFTLHNSFPKPEAVYARDLIEKVKGENYISISNSFRKTMPDLNYIATVYNGIDTDFYSYSDKSKGYLLWAGRFSPVKGTKEAIQVAKKLKQKIYLAGKMDPVDHIYIDEVKQMIDDQGVINLGEKKREEMVGLYHGAEVVLAPLCWDEPFGLVMAEAMSCGTPVVAFNRGSAAELIIEGKTGFLVEPGDIEGMAEAVKKAKRINRRDCRAHVIKEFSTSRMISNYLDAYQKVLSL